MPVFDDWECVKSLLPVLDRVLFELGLDASVILVDDASTSLGLSAEDVAVDELTAVSRVEVIKLQRNLGHQRAICIGLAYLAANAHEAVIVMDSDGEDDPREIVGMWRKFEEAGGKEVIFGERTKRSEGTVFRLGYTAYRWLFWILAGVRVRFGNFSVLAPMHVQALSVVPELWNHYAAAIIAAKIPFRAVPTTRALRVSGESRMNYLALAIHGLSALSAFSDRIGARVLVASLVAILIAAVGLAAVFAIRIFTDAAIPGWATFTTGLLLVLGVQFATFMFSFCFSILNGRDSATFIPARDHGFFIDRVERLL